MLLAFVMLWIGVAIGFGCAALFGLGEAGRGLDEAPGGAARGATVIPLAARRPDRP